MWAASFDPLRFEEAFEFFSELVPMTREQVAELSFEARQRAFWVSHVAEADVVADVFDELVRAIDTGETFDSFQRRAGGVLMANWLAEDVPDPVWRMETIFRTNLQTAYAAGRLQAQTDPAVMAARPFWMYDALIDGRTSDVCRVLNGTIRPADDQWWGTRYPPNHYNCRSSVRSLTPEQVEARGGVTQNPTIQVGDDSWRTMPGFDPPPLKPYPPEIAGDVLDKISRQVEPPTAAPIDTPRTITVDTSRLPPEMREEVEETLNSIRRVHGDGGITKTLTVTNRATRGQESGSFRRSTSASGSNINLTQLDAANLGETFTHEYGHFIDHILNQDEQQDYDYFLTENTAYIGDPIYDLMVTIRRSSSYEKLRGRTRNTKWTNYATNNQEIFARAYSQYIAVESNDPRLLATLNRVRSGEVNGFPPELQWGDDEFEPIRQAMTRLLESRGLK